MIPTNLGRYFMKTPRDPDAPLRKGMKTVDSGGDADGHGHWDGGLHGP